MSESLKEKPAIISVQEFLGMDRVVIPEYQRPYKWTVKNVHALIDDVLANQSCSAYRLGTIVFHDDGKMNVVDGQQRSITLTLLFTALRKNMRTNKLLQDIWPSIPIKFSLTEQEFPHAISRENIYLNYQAIVERLEEFDEKAVAFLLHKCELVKVVLAKVSEAFQFFDSQNSRGKDLEPHDLLKAFHLREMREESPISVLETVSGWETVETDELSDLFGNWLYRIRNWANLRSARRFSKNEVDIFKGVNPDSDAVYPYGQIYRTAHFCVNDFNASPHSRILNQKMVFPFQLDQLIVNGKRFFEMTDYYNCKRSKLEATMKDSGRLDDILTAINTYPGCGRDGDKYVRNMFNCACFYFWDKFGMTKEFFLVIRRIFFWAYYLRLTYEKLSFPSVDNYAIRWDSMMLKIHQAMKPSELIAGTAQVVEKVKSTKTKLIEDVFRSAGLLK